MELTIELRPRPGKFQELYQTLQGLLPTIRKEKGCRGCRISCKVDDEEIFSLSVHWEALASLEHYMQSVSGFALLGAIELLSDTARVRFGRHTPWEGIEILRKMIKKKN
jgi:quinol monooxygenase YgiN